MADRPALSNELWQRLTEALGLPTDTDAETVVATVEDLVTTPAPNADPDKVAAAAGLTLVDPGTLAQLQADAQQGRTIAAATAKRQATDTVDTAIREGKIPPARREHWITLLGNDATMGTTLASMPVGLVPIVEAGHSANENDLTEQADWIR